MSEDWKISDQQFYALLMSGFIVDGRAGGLILGRSHAEGGIWVISKNLEGGFTFVAEVEGGEYFVNRDAYEASKERIEEIMRHAGDGIVSMIPRDVTPKMRVIHTCAHPDPKIIWIDGRGQPIISRTRASRHLAELEDLNEKGNSFSEFKITDYL